MTIEEEEEDQDQNKPTDDDDDDNSEFKSNEKQSANTAVKTLGGANNTEHDHHTTAIDDVTNQSDSIAAEKQQPENGEEQHGFQSPSASTSSRTVSDSGNGENKNDDVEEVLSKDGGVLESEMELRKETGEEEDGVALAEAHEEEEGERVKAVEEQNSLLFRLEPNSVAVEVDESGTEEEQAAFMKEVEAFHKERFLEFKPPRFYGEPLNCLKLWRSVVRLGGYEQVTSCKLWRQVGESFNPPKTCTTVSWTFRCFYEKALLEYEKYKISIGELPFTDVSSADPVSSLRQTGINQTPGSGRARRDAAARAMQGWHSQRIGNGESGDPVIKDRTSSTAVKREKQGIGLLKRKKPSSVERVVKVARMKTSKQQLESPVVDVGPPADWVKINVQRTKDCFEVYALVPGLLREEVRVQSDPAGRLVISGQPEQLDNPWGVSPFKKVVSLPSRIDPHQTSAVVTLHGQLFVRVPFEQPAIS